MDLSRVELLSRSGICVCCSFTGLALLVLRAGTIHYPGWWDALVSFFASKPTRDNLTSASVGVLSAALNGVRLQTLEPC